MNIIDKIDFYEVEYFYKSPLSLVDYTQMQSFSLIKSCIEVFAYYGITDFKSSDVKNFFQKLQLVQQKNGKVFIPSLKKVDGVLECCFAKNKNMLSFDNGVYHIVSWDSSGYGYELRAAELSGKINRPAQPV